MEKYAHNHKIGKLHGIYSSDPTLEKRFASPHHWVKWYLEHSLVITKISKVVKYTPVAAFKDFTVEVANAHLQVPLKVHSHCRAYEIDRKFVLWNNHHGQNEAS